MDLVNIKYYENLPELPADAESRIEHVIEREKASLNALGDGQIVETTDLKLMDNGTCFAIFANSAMSLPEGVCEKPDFFIAYRPALHNGRAFRVVPRHFTLFPSGGLYWVYDSDSPGWTLRWYTDVQKISLFELKSYNLENPNRKHLANSA